MRLVKLIWIVSLFVLFFSADAPAQGFGLQVGLNLANARFEGAPAGASFSTSHRSTEVIGLIAEFNIGDPFSLDVEAEYVGKGAKVSSSIPVFGSTSAVLKFTYIEFPITLKWKLDLGPVRSYFFTGPDVGAMIVSVMESDGQRYIYDKYSNYLDVAIDFGTGLEYPISTQTSIIANVRYSMGMVNIVRPISITGETSWMSRDIKIVIGVLFR